MIATAGAALRINPTENNRFGTSTSTRIGGGIAEKLISKKYPERFRRLEEIKTMTETLEDRWHNLRCDAQRSIRYHMARVRFFQGFSSFFSFLGLLSGSAVIVAILASAPSWVSLTAGATIASAQAIELIGGISSKARFHSTLASEFSGVEQAMVLSGDQPKETAYRRLEAERLQIEAREPPIKRWLDVICHNEVARAMGLNDIYHVPLWARIGAQWFTGPNTSPKPIST